MDLGLQENLELVCTFRTEVAEGQLVIIILQQNRVGNTSGISTCMTVNKDLESIGEPQCSKACASATQNQRPVS